MKDLKVLFEDTLDLDEKNNYKVGDNVQFNLDDVARANPKKQIQDDSGKIIAISAGGYTVKSHLDGTEFKVANKHVISYGSAGADGQVP